MDLLEAVVEEVCQTKLWPRKVQNYPSGVKILAGGSSEKLIIAQVALQQLEEIIPLSRDDKYDWLMSGKGNIADILHLILQEVLQQIRATIKQDNRKETEHMTHAQMIEGTTEEITRQLQQSYAGQKLRVFIEPEEMENLAAELPDPPDTIRDQAHLIELLREGMKGDPQPIREQEWAEIRQEVRDRLAQKK